MTGGNEIRHGGLCWRPAADAAGELAALLAGGLPLDAWLAGGQATVVKQTPHRTVYRIVLPGLDVHLKHYRGEPRDHFRRLFRGSRGRREFDLTSEVARRGVPSLGVIGYADGNSLLGKLDSCFVTRTLPDAVSLLDFLETTLPALAARRRALLQQRLAEAVGRLLAVLHGAGVCHADLHPGNILLRLIDDQPELVLIDLGMVRLSGPLRWPAARANLIVLDRWFALRWSRTDRRRAWRAYCRGRPDLGLDEPTAAAALEEATHESLLGQLRAFDRRCFGGNRHFRAVHANGVSGYCVSDLDPAAVAALLADPDAPFAQAEARLLKCSASSAVVEVPLPGAASPRPVICKRLPVRSARAPLAALLRPPLALRSYVLGHGLRLRGLPTPRPLAVLHRRRFGLLWEGYLLVEKVPESIHLHGFVEAVAGLEPRQRRRRLGAVLDELAALLRRLHRWRFAHRDLKAANLLVSPASWTMGARGVRELPPDAAEPRDRVWFVDLHGLRRQRRVGKQRRVRDLSRLHLSFLTHPGLTRTDRLRFLLGYLTRAEYAGGGWKSWWNAIEAAAQARARQHRRLGRVIG